MHTGSRYNLNVNSVLNVEVTWTYSDSRPSRRVVIMHMVIRVAAALLTLKHRRCGLGDRASIPDRGIRTSSAEVRNERSYASTPAWLQCVHWGHFIFAIVLCACGGVVGVLALLQNTKTNRCQDEYLSQSVDICLYLRTNYGYKERSSFTSWCTTNGVL